MSLNQGKCCGCQCPIVQIALWNRGNRQNIAFPFESVHGLTNAYKISISIVLWCIKSESSVAQSKTRVAKSSRRFSHRNGEFPCDMGLNQIAAYIENALHPNLIQVYFGFAAICAIFTYKNLFPHSTLHLITDVLFDSQEQDNKKNRKNAIFARNSPTILFCLLSLYRKLYAFEIH